MARATITTITIHDRNDMAAIIRSIPMRITMLTTISLTTQLHMTRAQERDMAPSPRITGRMKKTKGP
jgi:hypothetical protein